ncbi:uncharacterized protein RCC_07965 [Ramularia collo-cygni]|uniref:Uncharacterized protein n=1 Tax=Ramularia collo-cygni TaxID=112498 RepID=A0A2D3VE37_9PEZI|nr:uncharacterized protein RCC_07965 [Ramularia collo-cygni]CZT22096.1 uncharacterized protein RCC_07965 [Ramularia collo-cygni]
MKRVIRDLVEKNDEEDAQAEGDENAADEDELPEDEDNESDQDDRKERQKAAEFEKNSFRSPKFWLKWQGQLLTDGAEEEFITDGGYIVFSGNACEKFDGTLSCEKLGWKNAKVSGWKIKGMSARDFEIEWVAEKDIES